MVILLLVICLSGLLCLTGSVEIDVAVLSHVSCAGYADGSARVTVLSGTPPYIYSWSGTSQTSDTASSLQAGVYVVAVKDANSTASQSVTILQPSQLTAIPFDYAVPSSCDSLGSVTALADGGTPPYKYVWSNLSTAGDFSILLAPPPFIVYTETLVSAFYLDDPNIIVSNTSMDIAGHSGLHSLKVHSVKAQPFGLLCAAANPRCIDAAKYGALEIWVWKETIGSLMYMGLYVDEGETPSVTAFPFTAAGAWTKVTLDLSSVVQTNYTGIYFATDDAMQFYIDDVAFLPRDPVFLATPYEGIGIIGAGIDTPTGVYGPAGSYQVQLTDINKCTSSSLSVPITQTTPLASSATVTGFNISVATTGGSPPYSFVIYSRNYTSSQGVFTDLSPGNYTIDITDKRGCKQEISVVVSPPPPPSSTGTIGTTFPPTSGPTSSTSTGGQVLPHPDDNPLGNFHVINGFLATLAGLCALGTIFIACVVWKRQHDLRPHTPFFCYTVLVGAFLGYIAAILALLDQSWGTVVAFSWTVDISVTIIYGTMFAKSMQILNILDNFTKFVSIDTSDRYMSKIFCFILIPELIILLIWTSLNGSVIPTWQRSDVIFWNIFLAYKGTVGLIVSFMCFRMRYKFSEYVEIKQIALCHVSLELVLLFLLVFTIVARDRYSELFVAGQSLSVTMIMTIPLGVIFLPTLSRGLKEWRDDQKTKKWSKLKTVYK